MFTGRRRVDEDLMEELEEALITADVGVETTMKILDRLRKRARFEAYAEVEELYTRCCGRRLRACSRATTQAPLQRHGFTPRGDGGRGQWSGQDHVDWQARLALQASGESESYWGPRTRSGQPPSINLQVWSERAGVDIVAQHMGADPAAVAYDTLEAAVARNSEVVIIDTAGRLHNKRGLMEELTKVRRIMDRIVPGCAARSAAGFGWLDRPKRGGASQAIHLGDRSDGAGAHEVGWHGQRRSGPRHL